MKTEILSVSVFDEDFDKKINIAADIIKNGGLVVFPTETVYGLGADATNPEAARSIYTAKGRPSDNPLIIHIAKPADAEKYTFTNEIYYKLAERFMPGPLTVILKAKDNIPLATRAGLDTVAVRCPENKIARSLIEFSGVPVAAPSANLSGTPSPTTAQHVIDDMLGRVDMIIDGGECDIGLESTIVALDGDSLTLLRPGAITVDALSCVCEDVKVAPAVLERLSDDERPLSPGMKYRHYAPDAPFVLLDGKKEDVLRFMKESEKDAVLLCYDSEVNELDGHRLIPVGDESDLTKEAHDLFSALRKADRMNASVIYAHLPPSEGIGLALYNRMLRAAAHTVRYIESKED